MLPKSNTFFKKSTKSVCPIPHIAERSGVNKTGDSKLSVMVLLSSAILKLKNLVSNALKIFLGWSKAAILIISLCSIPENTAKPLSPSLFKAFLLGGGVAMFAISLGIMILLPEAIRESLLSVLGKSLSTATIEAMRKNWMIIWIDVWMIFGVFITSSIALHVSLKSMRKMPLSDKFLWHIVFWLGFEVCSTLICSGLLTGSYIYFFSLCPHLFWPRVGLLALVLVSLLIIILHQYYNNRFTAWLSFMFSCLLLLVMVMVIMIIIGNMFF